MSFERLNELKMSRNLMQKAIADGIHVPLRTYQRYEYGNQVPNACIATVIASTLGSTVEEIWGNNIHKLTK